MSNINPATGMPREEPLIDVLLRDTLPEIKLALGRLIDRENARALPERYAQLLPETVLVVTLRPDAAQAILKVAKQVEAELTDSCMRHGSLYDREYRVQLRRAEVDNAPLYAVSLHLREELEQVEAERLTEHDATSAATVAAVDDGDRTTAATAPEAPGFDPDATRVEGISAPAGWEPGRWALVVEDMEGAEQERFPLTEPSTTVGRQTDNARLRADVAIADAPHVSRRQLALAWEPRAGEPGFRVYNLGLNPVHLPDRDVPGANLKQGPLRLEQLQGEHVARLEPGTPLRIGEKGPVLRVVEAGPPPVDPDATQLG